jgi:hypothetical protein
VAKTGTGPPRPREPTIADDEKRHCPVNGVRKFENFTTVVAYLQTRLTSAAPD